MPHRCRGQVEGQQQRLPIPRALEHQHRLGAVEEADRTAGQHRLGMTPGQERAERIEHRIGRGLLRLHRQRAVLGRDRQPWPGRAEAGQLAAGPRHRRTAAVAALEVRPEGDAVGVAQCLERHVGFAQAQFLALVDAHRAAQRAHQRDQHPGHRRVGRVPPPAGHRALHVVVGHRPARPAVAHGRLQLLHRGADVAGTVVVHQQLEAVAHVQAARRGVLGGGRQRILGGNLAQRHRARVLVQQRAQALEEADVLRPGVVVVVVLEGVRVVRAEAAAHALALRLGRVVAQLRVVETEIDRIQAEAVDATVQPELHVVQRGLLHRRVVEIQVRLRRQEVVQVVLAPARLPLPGYPAEDRQPVVGRGAVFARIGPHIPVGPGVVAALPALAEPRVLVGGVAEHLVDHHLQAQRMRPGQQPVEVVQRAEQRVDVALVGDVVAEIGHRRAEERRYPDRIHAQRGDVIEPVDDARQVTDAIAVGVQEAARIDLVDDGAPPPGSVRHRAPLRACACPRPGMDEPRQLSGGTGAMARSAYVFTRVPAAAPGHRRHRL